MSHPRNRLDEVIHSPVRFSVVAALAAVDRAEFRVVRDTVEVSDSVLSKQITVLESAGYVKVHKFTVGRRTRTSLSLTKEGQAAFERHVAALREIAAGTALEGSSVGEPTE
ncbi:MULTISPECIES: winged helix-turn-helix domain-containing protein [Nocardiopsis]|uniref:Transcriptional regulator n=1 Tax=Nocardiopsis lambiniae TaxID=3075539 RepID=A0ABU2M9R5_9ACTN|nr:MULTISPECIES: transcriptional regulator [unclassified Nocardiopsis]MDE3724959.1 transcriptional regulator [Nocardiopsis sp. N85]MDT0329323.1 transcriptional regulator [Nocardiopsis sp. DSM 44743]